MSDQAKPTQKTLAQEILHLAGVLLIITAIAAGLLGWVNGITEQRIAAINLEKINTALAQVFPGAQFTEVPVAPSADASIRAAWNAEINGAPAGMCIQVAPSGFGGEIITIVGIDLEGGITGVQITRQTETAGLGTKSQDPAWLAQFSGLTGPLTVVKNAKTADSDIVAITAATVTSEAVVRGVNAALTYAGSAMGGNS